VALRPALSRRSIGSTTRTPGIAQLEAGPSFVHAPSVAFRAHRDYLHSTTLFKELLAGAEAAGLAPEGPIELRVRRLMRREPELHYSPSPITAFEDAPAVFSLQASGAVWQGAVVERELPITAREPYDETPIASGAVIEGTSVRVVGPTGMHPIEVITSLTLLLHQRLFKIGDDRKWYLARLELTRPLQASDGDNTRIDLVRRFGTTMTRSSIAVGEERIGQIEFIAGPIG
jgi:hypothetical protein